MSASPQGGASHAIVGRVRRAHGVRGELYLDVMTDAPDAIFAPGARLFAGTTAGDLARDGATLTVSGARPFKDGLLVTFEEVRDRNAADLWRERYLLVPMDELTPPDEDEVFLHDLVGLQVQRADGTPVGTVVAYYELPHDVLLEIQRDGSRVLLPFRDEFVAELDVEGGVMVIAPPEGLLD